MFSLMEKKEREREREEKEREKKKERELGCTKQPVVDPLASNGNTIGIITPGIE